MNWKEVSRPGHFGKNRDEIYKQFDDLYGKKNWRIVWKWGNSVVPYDIACHIYEIGYYNDSFNRENLWRELVETASDVYDHYPLDVESGFDYFIQKSNSTHLQDIAIRRVVLMRGWRFKGKELVQIRSHNEYWGQNLSPGRVQFHLPELIVSPHLEDWWDYNSIEDFYQSNKILQARD